MFCIYIFLDKFKDTIVFIIINAYNKIGIDCDELKMNTMLF